MAKACSVASGIPGRNLAYICT